MRRVVTCSIIYLIFLSGCRFPKFEKPKSQKEAADIPEYGVVFHEIDNYASIHVNGTEIWKSKAPLSTSMKKIVIDLKPSLLAGDNKINVKLIDTPGTTCLDNRWAITYDIYSEGEIMDYWSESKKYAGCDGGIKVDNTYTIEY